MERNPRISIIIPLYNKERYIQRTLDSVFQQTVQDFEIIIIDSSSDQSTRIVRKNPDPRILHIVRDRTRAAMARNLGAQAAHTDFFAFLDADDEWRPDHLETLLRLRKQFPNAGLYSTAYVKLMSDGSPMVMVFAGIPPPPWEGTIPDYLQSCSRGDEPVNSSSCAMPRDVFQRMGEFPEDLVYGEDQYLWGRIAFEYPIAYSWNGLAIYHTEASGRVCEEVHQVREHPFSTWIRRTMENGNLSPEQQATCRAYLRRKKVPELISRVLMGPSSPRSSGSGARCTNRVGTILSCVIRSPLQQAVRSLLCRYYHCYDPGKSLR